MNVSEIIRRNQTSKYRVAKNSGIPYMTLNDICTGKTQLGKCSAETVYKLSKELGVSMEELLTPHLAPRLSFDLFKSNVCHRLKELGDIDFLIEVLEGDDVTAYYRKSWFPECLYLLALVDYISRVNGIPLVDAYNDLQSPGFPSKQGWPRQMKEIQYDKKNPDSIPCHAAHPLDGMHGIGRSR